MLPLTIATVIFAFILIVKGGGLAFGEKRFIRWGIEILYYRKTSLVLWTIAIGWTLWETMKLGPSDFGGFKLPLFIVFAGLGVASVWMLRDYLIVRAAAVINLYVCWYFLKAAFLQPEWTRLFLVAPVYLAIIASLWLAVAPWRVRDLLLWMQEKPLRWRILGWTKLVYGTLLLVVAATYRFFL